MDIPILGTVDLTPTGIFLTLAALLALGYFGWQLFAVGRAARAKKDDGAGDVPEGDAVAGPDDAADPGRPGPVG